MNNVNSPLNNKQIQVSSYLNLWIYRITILRSFICIWTKFESNHLLICAFFHLEFQPVLIVFKKSDLRTFQFACARLLLQIKNCIEYHHLAIIKSIHLFGSSFQLTNYIIQGACFPSFLRPKSLDNAQKVHISYSKLIQYAIFCPWEIFSDTSSECPKFIPNYILPQFWVRVEILVSNYTYILKFYNVRCNIFSYGFYSFQIYILVIDFSYPFYYNYNWGLFFGRNKN